MTPSDALKSRRLSHMVPFLWEAPSSPLDWEGPGWADVPRLHLGFVLEASSDHRPHTEVKLARDERCLHILFRVQDRYVKSVHTHFQDMVCRDSCVEAFLQPDPHQGYFNFEVNAGGTLHVSYILDATRTAEGFEDYVRLPPDLGERVTVRTSLPAVIDPELEEETTWTAYIGIPFALLEVYVGPLDLSAREAHWRANFYKCADATSHPHWLCWSPIAERNYHRPQDFGTLIIEGDGQPMEEEEI